MSMLSHLRHGVGSDVCMPKSSSPTSPCTTRPAEAPANYAEIARFLAGLGIDSICVKSREPNANHDCGARGMSS